MPDDLAKVSNVVKNDVVKKTEYNTLKSKVDGIAKDQKYDGYQRGLASMVYKFFGKKSKGSGAKHVNINFTPQNQQLFNI